MSCYNPEIQSIRSLALYEVSKLIPQFIMLPIEQQFKYIISCCDIECTKIIAPLIAKRKSHID